MTMLKDIEDMKAMALDAKQVDELVGEGGTCVALGTAIAAGVGSEDTASRKSGRTDGSVPDVDLRG